MVVYANGFSGGDILLPPSKSAAHRALLCAALSRGKCIISNIDSSKDMEAALGAIRALGARADYDPERKTVTLDSTALGEAKQGAIDCLESGNTLRFVVPICAALGGQWELTGSGRLPQRPMGVYRDLLPHHGVEYRTPGREELPLSLSGRLTPGLFEVPGNISSQFITGLLLALPLLEGDSDIRLTSPLESEGYVDLTLSVLREFAIKIEKTADGWHVPGGQKYTARDLTVEGDWSHAAFFLSMAALDPRGREIRLHGLDKNSVQGDRSCVERFAEFGLRTRWDGDILTAWNPDFHKPYGGLRGCTVDVSQIPDMLPALSVCAALSEGETRFVHAERVRLKESDRLSAMEDAINALGGEAYTTEDQLIVRGRPALRGGTAEGRNDHRVVMALAAAALRSETPVQVTDEWSIRKTYPGFFRDFEQLGGTARVIDLG